MEGTLDGGLQTKSRLMAQGYEPFMGRAEEIPEEQLKCPAGCDARPSIQQFRRGNEVRRYRVCGRCGLFAELPS